MKLLNIGFGNLVCLDRVVAIVTPESAPIKRIVQEAKDRGVCIDATYGRRTKSVLITDTDHVILSAIQSDTLRRRAADDTGTDGGAEDEGGADAAEESADTGNEAEDMAL